MDFSKMSSEPDFEDKDTFDPDGEVARRAKVVRGWLDDILMSDLKGKSNQANFVLESRKRIEDHGDATTFTKKQFYFMRGIWERATGDETDETF